MNTRKDNESVLQQVYLQYIATAWKPKKLFHA